MKIVSVAFHPLLIATHLSLLILFLAPELLPGIQPQAYRHFLLLVFIITAVMPALSLFLLKAFKYISDLELKKRNERALPFAFILFYYGIASYLFMVKLEMGWLFNLVMISVTVLILLLLIISTRFKISIHAAAAWSAAGYLTAILITQHITLNWVYYLTLCLAGLTTASRLYLGYHTPKEAWLGAVLGFCYSLLIFVVLI